MRRSRYVRRLLTLSCAHLEFQELYRSCMALRPKVVKLIDKYSQKRGTPISSFGFERQVMNSDAADLVSMNETFVKARTIFDRMMEDSLARHSGCMTFLFTFMFRKFTSSIASL